ncbi:uncharacterized protein CG13380 [Bombus pyrosoma]|uniref:uncharacterized protein CG13380 n=1 Tax=Bombus pyrosoma TaxID=396416 RepID=UPI001CB93652|nr:uncharacterized protein CG13380 [Bombus pyrosoma]XP_043588600.1 uncharacterized protein CG13380 [Bombus pyrosoma]XP_043588601.1 uncharacterized protein CG13380 [Bombus pyrosoma]XP_043588602.1 uncharacterized protein CG13380 [Bombus pyrosoma]XP_043588604.1 uncharacterized protein CG13380 [Bombus pyrosoma]XP_043588605.1 uncharacterized protein CG13380 [Bombus pyrosoma]
MNVNLNYNNYERRVARGRGIARSNLPADRCLCHRPYTVVLCNVCGYWTKGRVRYFCPIHPQVVFLFDIPQCPQCKSYGFMLSEY